MKQDEAQKIAAWLNGTLMLMIEGMYDFPLMGDDGWQEAFQDALADIRTEKDHFIQDNLLPVQKITSREREFGDMLSRLSAKQLAWENGPGTDMTPVDWKYLYQARLFKQVLMYAREDPEISKLNDKAQLFQYLEAEILPRTEFKGKFYTQEYMRVGEEALDDVVKIILDTRAAAPQAKLFS